MPIPKDTWARMNFSAPGRTSKDFELSEPIIMEESDRKAIADARQYFDEFNQACSFTENHVMAFIRLEGINYPYNSLQSSELEAKMKKGHCLHYTKAGILALALDEKLKEMTR
tara:strand:- start:40 stop:378 length:339 start_codon:yes stop_codon:yes gene_type:complete